MTDPSQDRITSLEQRLAKNPQSPLFARLADSYLRAGRANDALRLCDDGLALYPFYATAHLVKAKVLTHLGMMAEARHAYEVVRELLPTNESVLRLAAVAEENAPQEAEVETAVAETIVAEPPQPVVQEIVTEETVVEEVEPAPVQEPQAAPVEEEASPFGEPITEEPATIEEQPIQAEQPPEVEAVVEEPPPSAPAETTPQVDETYGFGEQPTAEPAQQADDGFGFGEQPVAEPKPEEPSAADKLGLDMQPEPQQDYSSFDFGAPAEQPSAAPVEENPFGTQPAEEAPQAVAEPEPEPQQAPSPFEMPAAAAASPEPTPEPAPAASADQTSDWFEAFSQLQQPTEETTEAPVAANQAEEENPFAIFGTEQSSAPVEAEPFDEFAARARMELFGTEDTLSLEEYLAQTGSTEAPPTAPDNIGELAEKLKTSPRITPPVINFSEKAQRTGGESDAAGGSGFVTPTLAEIYVKQGWFDDAIKAYKALAANKPAEKEKFEQRIAEIEEMKKK
jgi:hypothetical protein